jgi:hypothetical protein
VLVKGPYVEVEGELSVNSGIVPPTSIAIDYIFELSPGSEVNRSKKPKTKAIVVDEKRRKKQTRKPGYTGYTSSKEVTIHHGLGKGPTSQPTINQWA